MSEQIKIGIIGDYNPDARTHLATDAAIQHAADALGITAAVDWLATPMLETETASTLQPFHALWCAPGSPYQSMSGALQAIRFAREANVPFIGTCGGFQHVVIEYARNVLGFVDAQHAEYDPDASTLFVSALSCSLVGKSMQVFLAPGSRAMTFYRQNPVTEQYYCQFGITPQYQPLLHEGGLCIVGYDQDQEARILELPAQRFFVATLFVPQLTSTDAQPHPLIVAYLRAALAFAGELGVANDEADHRNSQFATGS
jgi:CTP synthase (UTP-ammonia lyase)